MAWRPHWTAGAWSDIQHMSGAQQQALIDAVLGFCRTGQGLTPDVNAPGIGWLTVGIYEIELARREEHSFFNDDGEEIVIRDAIVVLSVVAVDPNP